MLTVFISHAHEESDLALAWQKLLQHTSQGAVDVWLSSDTRPTGGVELGSEWRSNVYTKVSASQFVLAIVSPRTVDRPWILWECGMASGVDKERGIIPILFSMGYADFSGPLASYQTYLGEDSDKVKEVCERLLTSAGLQPKPQYWGPIVESYLSSVRVHRPARVAAPEAKEVWFRRMVDLLNSGRSSELPGMRDAMYATFGGDDPVDLRIHDLLSQVFLENRRYDLASLEVEKALKLQSDDLNMHHRRVLIALEQKQLAQAQAALGNLLQTFPDSRYLPEIAGLEGRLHRELFEANGRQEDLDAAIKAYEAAYVRDRYNYYSGVNVASLSLIAGNLEKAQAVAADLLNVCKELQAHAKVSFWTDFTIGELYLILGNVDQALSDYKTGLSRDPSPGDRSRESAFRRVKSLLDQFGLSERVSDFATVLR